MFFYYFKLCFKGTCTDFFPLGNTLSHIPQLQRSPHYCQKGKKEEKKKSPSTMNNYCLFANAYTVYTCSLLAIRAFRQFCFLKKQHSIFLYIEKCVFVEHVNLTVHRFFHHNESFCLHLQYIPGPL